MPNSHHPIFSKHTSTAQIVRLGIGIILVEAATRFVSCGRSSRQMGDHSARSKGARSRMFRVGLCIRGHWSSTSLHWSLDDPACVRVFLIRDQHDVFSVCFFWFRQVKSLESEGMSRRMGKFFAGLHMDDIDGGGCFEFKWICKSQELHTLGVSYYQQQSVNKNITIILDEKGLQLNHHHPLLLAIGQRNSIPHYPSVVTY